MAAIGAGGFAYRPAVPGRLWLPGWAERSFSETLTSATSTIVWGHSAAGADDRGQEMSAMANEAACGVALLGVRAEGGTRAQGFRGRRFPRHFGLGGNGGGS
jgi:hypothetical protein